MFKAGAGRSGAGRARICALDARLERNHYVVTALGGAGLALMIIENHRLWHLSGEPDALCEVLKIVTSFLTAWQLLFLYLYYFRKYEQMKLTNALLDQDTFVSSGLLGWLLVEAAIYLVHAPPFISGEVEYDYYDVRRGLWLTTSISTDELATLWMAFARVPPLFLRLIRFISGIETDQSRGCAAAIGRAAEIARACASVDRALPAPPQLCPPQPPQA